MYKIKKARNGQYFATFQAKNNEPLNHTEQEVQKASIWKNIKATIRGHKSSEPIKVIDTTIKIQMRNKAGKAIGKPEHPTFMVSATGKVQATKIYLLN